MLRLIFSLCEEMKIYWNLKTIPELQDKPLNLRLMAWFCCVHKTLFHWQIWPPFIIAIGLCFLSAYFVAIYRSIIGGTLFFLLSFVAIMILNNIQCSIIRPYLREYFTSNKRT